ncbi:hypothetical protein DV707_04960 [Halobellus limi]|uniref:Uncharacterized protein n=2 Tax=Halobellus limi TaxID=699433 RepID=A0A1H5UD32_9EURY|nr:hypothetical protein DV707_04960 [Halobellus limi]SEF72924.1 hypothetical protein SAMN04488133_0559 [Halobellus limi]
MLLVGATPMAALAQGASDPRPVLLDQETTHIADITVDGQQYSVYRHENIFSWASGIDIYTNSERVTSESTAEAVLTELAQRRAAQDLGTEDIDPLRTTSQNVSTAASNVSSTATSINETLVYMERMKTVRENGTTVYNASVQAAPQITDFNETAHEALPELRSFDNDSTAYRSNATTLIGLLEQRENGTDIDPQRLYAQYVATLEAKNDVSDHLGYEGIDEQLSGMAGTSEAIAMNVSSVPERGNETAQHFWRVHNESTVTANQTAALALSDYEFDDVQDRAESLEEGWMDDWNSRQNPASTVYQSIAAIVVVIGVVGGYVTWRRR